MYACACTQKEAFGAALVMNSRKDFHVALQNHDGLILGDSSELRKYVYAKFDNEVHFQMRCGNF